MYLICQHPQYEEVLQSNCFNLGTLPTWIIEETLPLPHPERVPWHELQRSVAVGHQHSSPRFGGSFGF